MSFYGLIKGISPKICILCVSVKINKRSFEPFCVWISFQDSLLSSTTPKYLCLLALPTTSPFNQTKQQQTKNKTTSVYLFKSVVVLVLFVDICWYFNNRKSSLIFWFRFFIH